MACCVCGSVDKVLRCSGCHTARYCSKKCQKEHHEYHSVYCKAISQLEELEKDKRYGSYSVREGQVNFKKQLKIAKLVGEKPMLSCQLGGKSCEGLWDTGSQILMIDRFWLAENLPDEVSNVLPVEEFLGGEKLTIRAANKSSIPFDGVVLLRFSLGKGHEGFMVPVLVSSQPMNEPIRVPRQASRKRSSAWVMLAKLTSTFDIEDAPRELFIVHSISEMP